MLCHTYHTIPYHILSHSDLHRFVLPRLVRLPFVRLVRRRQTVSGPEDPPFAIPSSIPAGLLWAGLLIPSPSPHGTCACLTLTFCVLSYNVG